MTSKRFMLSKRSWNVLDGVDPRLIVCTADALDVSDVDFMVFEGLRLMKRQKELFRKGRTRTLKSRHLTGHAVDLVPLIDGKLSWNRKDPRVKRAFEEIALSMKGAADRWDVSLEWGGDWCWDFAHFQLTWGRYPG